MVGHVFMLGFIWKLKELLRDMEDEEAFRAKAKDPKYAWQSSC